MDDETIKDIKTAGVEAINDFALEALAQEALNRGMDLQNMKNLRDEQHAYAEAANEGWNATERTLQAVRKRLSDVEDHDLYASDIAKELQFALTTLWAAFSSEGRCADGCASWQNDADCDCGYIAAVENPKEYIEQVLTESIGDGFLQSP